MMGIPANVQGHRPTPLQCNDGRNLRGDIPEFPEDMLSHRKIGVPGAVPRGDHDDSDRFPAKMEAAVPSSEARAFRLMFALRIGAALTSS
jgi:hypothetical protein